MKNTKAIGDIGEQIAAEYLEKEGYTILERNAEYAGCEADIICSCYVRSDGTIVRRNAQKSNFISRFFNSKSTNLQNTANKDFEKVIVFCEVKTRGGPDFGDGAEAVTPYKAGRYVTLAKAYVAKKFATDENIRFDIIEVCDGKVNHIQNAFTTNDARFYRN